MADITQDLDLASSMLGPMSPRYRNLILKLHANPTQKTWDAAHGIILHGPMMLTLWQAIIAVDPTFPRRGAATDLNGKVVEPWPRIPTPDLVRRAVRYATH